MMLFSQVRVNRKSSFLAPLTQLMAAAVVCIVGPFVVDVWSLPLGWREPAAQNTAIATLIALTVGFWLHRSVSALPGARETSAILPSHLTSFGLVFTSILLFRIFYSRAMLISVFVITVAWFYLVYMLTQRRANLLLGVVKGGKTDQFAHLERVECRPLSLKDDPASLDAVTADLRFNHSAEWERRLSDFVLAGIPVYHSKDLWESLTGRADLEHLSENNFGSLGPLAPFQNAKRAIDRVLAIPALVLAAPIMLLAALAIRLDTAGPVLFRQARMGFRGRDFNVIKFRTMTSNFQSADSAKREDFITREGDERITRVGKWLRRSRIDELPQILNILRGEMSWIGPRPEASALSEWYEEEIPFYRYRHVVVPGITGWAQVSQGHVAALDEVRTKLQYDFYYIRNFSVWLDLLIIAKTIRTVLTGFGHK